MLKKIFFSVLVIVLLLFLGIGILVTFQLREMRPVYTGEHRVDGLHGQVDVCWDSSGVIHIRGDNTSDVIFASGYAAAKERLWQMEMTRRVATGTLSEVFGDTTLNIDRLFLTLGIDSLTDKLYSNLSAESKLWLQQYARGINAYLDEIGDDYPLEFVLMRIRPRHWSPQDCLLQNRLMAWFLNFNWKADLLYWQLSVQLPHEKFQQIMPVWDNAPDIIPAEGMKALYQKLWQTDRQVRQILQLPSGGWGSNNWVVAPSKSRSGHALLANDPHLPLQLPSVWIEMELSAPDFHCAGFSFPGTPGIIIGRNDSIAWGVTNGMIDDSDYFLENADTLKGTYLSGGHEHKLGMHNRLIKIKGKTDEIFTIYSTDNGPLFNSVFPALSVSQFLAFKWTGFEMSDELQAFIKLSRAGNWHDFQLALSYFKVPAQNFVFASAKGNIGYYLAGSVPIRSYGKGMIPVSGQDQKNRWTGAVPFDKLPHIFNPARGWIVTANNRIVKNYPYYLSEYWEPPYRATRISDLLMESDSISKEDMGQIQYDDLSLAAQELVPVYLEDLDRNGDDPILDDNLKLLLSNWKYRMDPDAVAPSLYEVTSYMLIRNIFEDEMGEPMFNLFTDLPNFYWRIFLQVFRNTNSSWFDDISTPQRETRASLVRKSMKQAIQYLSGTLGKNEEDWTWGNLHTLELKHTLGQVKLTEMLFNRGPYPARGDVSTVDVGSYSYGQSYKMNVGPSLRFVVDWSEPGKYWSILPGGNSGNFVSPFYDNQIGDWLFGRLKQVSLNNCNLRNKVVLLPGK